jgi:hypothetical protein
MKLNVLLAQTDQLNGVVKKNVTDSIHTFKQKQGLFKGELITYREREEQYANPANNINKPVSSTVKEWLDYTFNLASDFLVAKMDQEATNCSGTATADLIIDGVNFGNFTTGELMALKGFFEQQPLKDMFEAMPTISLTERWTKSAAPEYARRDVRESAVQQWVDKVSETTPEVQWDPLGKQPGIVIQVKHTIEKADITKQAFTGEISHIERAEIMGRLTKIVIAIKSALEEANNANVVKSKLNAGKLFSYLKEGKGSE